MSVPRQVEHVLLSRSTLLVLCVAGTVAGSAPTAANAQPGQVVFVQRALLRGSVVDDADEKPIAGATVSIEVLKMQAITDSSGLFRIPNVPVGKHIVLVKRLGFSPVSAVLNFTTTDTTDYDFALARQATLLPEANVITTAPVPPKLAEFDERRRAGFGRFITPDVIEKNSNRRLSEVVAMMPGPRIVRGTGSNGWVASTVGPSSIQRRFRLSTMDVQRGADPKQCYAAVMLDGNLVFTGRTGEMLFDLNSIGTNSVSAIEYYRDAATVPAKFNVRGEETCGLVVIWTK